MSGLVTAEEIRSRKAQGTCVVASDESVLIDGNFQVSDLSGCLFETGSRLVFFYREEQHGTPEPAKRPVATDAGTQETDMDASIIGPVDVVPVETKAVVGQVEPLVADLAHIPKDPTMVGVLMAVVAVGGGGTAWKFYNDHSKRKHEQEMARIEKEDNSHKACSAVQATLEAKVAGLEAVVNELKTKNEQLSMQASSSPNVDELLERLENLEKSAGKKKGKR